MNNNRERQHKWRECVEEYRYEAKMLWDQFLADQQAYSAPVAYVVVVVPNGASSRVLSFASLDDAQKFLDGQHDPELSGRIVPIFQTERPPPMPHQQPLAAVDDECPF